MMSKIVRQRGSRVRLLALLMLLLFGIVCAPACLAQESQLAPASFVKPTRDAYLKLADEV